MLLFMSGYFFGMAAIILSLIFATWCKNKENIDDETSEDTSSIDKLG